MQAYVYTRPKQFGGYVTFITVDGKEYKGEGKIEAASLVAAQAVVQASNK